MTERRARLGARPSRSSLCCDAPGSSRARGCGHPVFFFRRTSAHLTTSAACRGERRTSQEPVASTQRHQTNAADKASDSSDTDWHAEWRWLSWLSKKASPATETVSPQPTTSVCDSADVRAAADAAEPTDTTVADARLSASPPPFPTQSPPLASRPRAESPGSVASDASICPSVAASPTSLNSPEAEAAAPVCVSAAPHAACPPGGALPAPAELPATPASSSAEAPHGVGALEGPSSPLVKFGDQTLTWLQRQQMRVWSFFALRDWRVKTLVHALSAMGAPVDLIVVDCAQKAPAASQPAAAPAGPPPHRGGYSPVYHTVWVCGNCFWSPFELRRVLLHELVHAFDFARAELSPDNCRHVACTEIRAYNLSGQCSWWATKRVDENQFQRINPALVDAQSAGCSALAGRRAGVPAEGPRSALGGEERLDELEGAPAGMERRGHVATFFTGGDAMPWQDTKRNRCLIHNALNSLRDHQQCRARGVAVSPTALRAEAPAWCACVVAFKPIHA
ncbi:hypothetical protein BESB_077330 [Besnoitia besnoiti]|uniref:Peptidase M76 family protein n=1 Tax=Besnoitia besnoiti TaxID=94643 RepID=A0A2A9MC65_BESBE|nr:hypothetical protein BESB_077330 [Besnoitia besnoiti]PFH33516.1 hypothetical protein BESB_077330 [Besnoitia besnoiti]